MRTLMAPFTWLGRVALWLLFFPLGWWRSVRHGRKKSERAVIKEVRKTRDS